VLLSTLNPALAAEAPSPASSPELAVTVSLEREDLKAGETRVPVRVWLSNPSDIEIGPVEAWLVGPKSIHLAGPPDRPEVDHLTLLPSLYPHQDYQGRLWLTVRSQVREGDYNLLFGFRYHTGAGGKDVNVMTVEKKVQLGVLGTESVGGFSLRLVALLLPGLLFWMVLQLFHAGTALQAAFDKGALAVLASLLLVALVTRRPPRFLAGGMSIEGLLFLCALGAGLGLVAGLLIALARRALRKATRERIVQPEDGDEETLRKLLALAAGGASARAFALLAIPGGGILRNPEIQLKDGRRLRGSLAGPTAEGFVVVGSYRVATPDKDLRQQLSALQEEGRWSELLDRARQAGLAPALDVSVKVKVGEPGAAWRDLSPVFRISRDDIASRGASSGSWSPVSVTP
jgi:hypothetical protein